MGCPTPVCAECTRSCLFIHGKNRDPSPVVKSFFKIMIGESFSEVLFLPPKMARTIPVGLFGKETQLEDASGQRWTVTLSLCEGSLAFHQGWPSFSREHALEVGDLMVFHYILGSHFVVQIYGKNGCERLHFSVENGSRKKRRTNTPSGAKDGKYHSIDSNSMNKEGQGTSALSGPIMEMVTDNPFNTYNGSPRKILNEEQLGRSGMDARHRHEGHKNFEMQRTSYVDGITGVLEHGNRMSRFQTGADMMDRTPATEKVVASAVPNLEGPEANKDFQMAEKVSVSTKDSGIGNTIEQELTEKTKSRKYQEPKGCGYNSNHPGKGEDHHVLKAVKTEPDDICDWPGFSLMVTETKAFVELPRALPRVKGKNFSLGDDDRRAVVLLQDPKSRLWPVVYHEKSKIKALTSGWEVFVNKNGIRTGDQCAFEVENEPECIYRVGIVRK